MNDIETIWDLIKDEFFRASQKYGAFSSEHEGYAVILEELDELWKEVKRNNTDKAVKEAIQVIAMGLRFVFDFGKQGEK